MILEKRKINEEKNLESLKQIKTFFFNPFLDCPCIEGTPVAKWCHHCLVTWI